MSQYFGFLNWIEIDKYNSISSSPPSYDKGTKSTRNLVKNRNWLFDVRRNNLDLVRPCGPAPDELNLEGRLWDDFGKRLEDSQITSAKVSPSDSFMGLLLTRSNNKFPL